jgi:signal transduction histidine kinase
MPGRQSVRVRTTAVAVVLVACGIAAASVAVLTIVHHSLLSRLDDLAETDIADLRAQLRSGSLPARLPDPGEDGAVKHVFGSDGTLVAVSAGASRRAPALEPPATGVRSGSLDGRRVSAATVLADGQQYSVWVTTDLEPVEEATGHLRTALLIVGPLLLLFVGTTTWVVVGRALRPVEAIRRRVADVTDQPAGVRVPVPDADDEIRRLALTMNAMLARLDEGAARQRRFVADASHELQTPLATMRAELEGALRGEPDATRSALTDALRSTATMEKLVRDLLYLARADDAKVTRDELVDLDDIVLEEAAALRVRSRVPIDASAVSAAAVRGGRSDLARVVRNLLDNAERHAASKVTLRLAEDDADAVLLVQDDGPGIDPAHREIVFERFTRLDEARSGSGTGLGLAIAREIVIAHGGTIEATDDGVVVRLPAAPD